MPSALFPLVLIVVRDIDKFSEEVRCFLELIHVFWPFKDFFHIFSFARFFTLVFSRGFDVRSRAAFVVPLAFAGLPPRPRVGRLCGPRSFRTGAGTVGLFSSTARRRSRRRFREKNDPAQFASLGLLAPRGLSPVAGEIDALPAEPLCRWGMAVPALQRAVVPHGGSRPEFPHETGREGGRPAAVAARLLPPQLGETASRKRNTGRRQRHGVAWRLGASRRGETRSRRRERARRG